MKRNITFHPEAFYEFTQWGQTNKQVRKKIEELIKDILRNSFDGLGKPEPLKADRAGQWSRRITDEHRLIYRVKDESIEIISCRGHY
ncbi:MAG: Txe/YoeB family addiction module toxin [Spirochaetes bacterium]|nr:Txe/YoeB family addiction module toxin [Spirochaetota bacterium]